MFRKYRSYSPSSKALTSAQSDHFVSCVMAKEEKQETGFNNTKSYVGMIEPILMNENHFNLASNELEADELLEGEIPLSDDEENDLSISDNNENLSNLSLSREELSTSKIYISDSINSTKAEVDTLKTQLKELKKLYDEKRKTITSMSFAEFLKQKKSTHMKPYLSNSLHSDFATQKPLSTIQELNKLREKIIGLRNDLEIKKQFHAQLLASQAELLSLSYSIGFFSESSHSTETSISDLRPTMTPKSG